MTESAALPLRDQGALVTGAGRGIGRAIAERLAALGASVLCVSRTQSDLEETARLAGSRAFTLVSDVSRDGAAEAMVRALLARAPTFDILVHCAGTVQTGTAERTSLAAFDRAFDVNVRAPFALTQTAIPHLRRSRGQVLFINSSVLRAANIAGRGIYAATKAALKSIADSLRDELNADGIRVLSVMPGQTATSRLQNLYDASGQTYRPDLLLQPGDIAQAACHQLLLPRTAEATDLFIRPMMKPPALA